MDKILVPYDFSDCAADALHYACGIARKTNAAIVLFSAFHPPPIDPNMPPNMAETMITERTERLQSELQKTKRLLPENIVGDVPVSTVVAMGLAAQSIVEKAEEIKAELILMGTTGASGINKVIGSITSGVISNSDIPVMAVPIGVKYNGIKKIVYASNFLPGDYQCIQQLTTFANYFDAHVTCLHVSKLDGEDVELQVNDLEEYFWQEMSEHKLDIKIIREPDFEEGIHNYIVETEIDLLAMLTEKRNFLDRIFEKSKTKKMAMHADVPLLAFHK